MLHRRFSGEPVRQSHGCNATAAAPTAAMNHSRTVTKRSEMYSTNAYLSTLTPTLRPSDQPVLRLPDAPGVRIRGLIITFHAAAVLGYQRHCNNRTREPQPNPR